MPTDGNGACPAQHALPPAVPLVGREDEIRRLIDETAAGRTLHLIEGMPGVGKTALALRLAHELAPRFPDAQFFIDLHAHTPGVRPVAPEDALHHLLTADGVPTSQVATDIAGRSAQWRSRLAGRRCLVVIDNARQRSHIAPLLPGDDGCLVLVTSRRRLAGLSVHHPATITELETLTAGHAAELFARRSGRDRHGADASAIVEIVAVCGLLPLPVCILAAKLSTQPRRRAAALLRELREAAHPTIHMRAEDLAVGPAFALSFRQLPPARRRFLRRLAMHPGVDLDVPAAAALAGVTAESARSHLDALFQEHLIDQRTDGHYRMHDLIGDYARSLGDGDGRTTAITRLADHYVGHLRDAGAALAVPYRAEDPAARLRRRLAALAWFQQKRASLLSCADTMAGAGAHRPLVSLAAALAPFLREAGPWERAVVLHRAAADSAARHDDHVAHAAALRHLGEACYLLGRYADAIQALRAALVVLRGRPGGDIAEALVLTRLGAAKRQAGHLTGAAADLTEAFDTLHRSGRQAEKADVLTELGMVRTRLADHDGAVAALREAVALQQEHGSLQSCAETLNQLGAVLQCRCEHEEAIVAHQRALELCAMTGDLREQARARNYLGHLWCETGRYERAVEVLADALSLHDRLGSPRGMGNALIYLGNAYRELGQYEEAYEATRRALVLYQSLSERFGYADGLTKLGVIHRLGGNLDAAAEAHQKALDVFAELDDPLGQADVLNDQGDLEHHRGRPRIALFRHRAALTFAERAGNAVQRDRARRGVERCLRLLPPPDPRTAGCCAVGGAGGPGNGAQWDGDGVSMGGQGPTGLLAERVVACGSVACERHGRVCT